MPCKGTYLWPLSACKGRSSPRDGQPGAKVLHGRDAKPHGIPGMVHNKGAQEIEDAREPAHLVREAIRPLVRVEDVFQEGCMTRARDRCDMKSGVQDAYSSQQHA